ncbi:MAG: autorepressor SdpR family transcription factor [Candidatus Peribacteraceae bacterium]|nr:autorepressor SdpR family transcription factor [Candidatus Peribacteraceae bacterium]
MDSVFKALSDPHRRDILKILKKGDLSVGEIATHFDFTGATLSHHLDILKRANLVVTERRGQFIFYSLNTSVLEDVLLSFSSFFSQ